MYSLSFSPVYILLFSPRQKDLVGRKQSLLLGCARPHRAARRARYRFYIHENFWDMLIASLVVNMPRRRREKRAREMFVGFGTLCCCYTRIRGFNMRVLPWCDFIYLLCRCEYYRIFFENSRFWRPTCIIVCATYLKREKNENYYFMQYVYAM